MPKNLVGHAIAILMLGGCAFLGVMALASGIGSLFSGTLDIGPFVVALIAGLAFGGMGLGGLYFLYGHEFASSWWQRRQFERWGDRPWMRKREWRRGRIAFRKTSPTVFLWIFALGWNAGVSVVLWGNRDLIAAQARENWISVLPAGLFPLVGLGVLAAAIRSSRAPRHGDRALFVMAAVPAWTGGSLEGCIETRVPAALKGRVKLKLASAGGAPIEAEVASGRLGEGPKGLTVPVVIPIPGSAEPTDEFDPKKKVIWTLEARMNLPGGDLEARFQVPVYRRPGPE